MARAKWRIAGRILKYVGIILIFTVTGFLIWRMLSSGDPSSVKRLTVNEKVVSAYDASEDGELYMYYQGQASITYGENNYGYFSVSQVAIIPDAHQIQLVIRYNNSTLRSIAEDLGLDSVPDRDADIFDVTLAVSTDLTPDDDTDNAWSAAEHPESVSEQVYYPSSEVLKDKKNVYNYRKYVFDGVDIDDLTLAVYVDIRYTGGGEANYGEPPMGTLCIYDYKSSNVQRKLSSADRDAILDFKRKNGDSANTEG